MVLFSHCRCVNSSIMTLCHAFADLLLSFIYELVVVHVACGCCRSRWLGVVLVGIVVVIVVVASDVGVMLLLPL